MNAQLASPDCQHDVMSRVTYTTGRWICVTDAHPECHFTLMSSMVDGPVAKPLFEVDAPVYDNDDGPKPPPDTSWMLDHTIRADYSDFPVVPMVLSIIAIVLAILGIVLALAA